MILAHPGRGDICVLKLMSLCAFKCTLCYKNARVHWKARKCNQGINHVNTYRFAKISLVSLNGYKNYREA